MPVDLRVEFIKGQIKIESSKLGNRCMVRNDLNNNNLSKIRGITRLMGYIVVLAFIAGIVVDADHPLAFLMGESHGRYLHPYFVISGAIFMGLGFVLVIACLCRYVLLRFLRNRGS